jgi:hypothetical protein
LIDNMIVPGRSSRGPIDRDGNVGVGKYVVDKIEDTAKRRVVGKPLSVAPTDTGAAR